MLYKFKSHFDPFSWTIKLNRHSSDGLLKDSPTREAFIHEYIHYIQSLISTLGRTFFLELIRNIIYAGIYKHYNGKIPSHFEQIDLKSELIKASPSDFKDSDVKKCFINNYCELSAALNSKLIPIQHTSDKFKYISFDVPGILNYKIMDFPHIVIHYQNKTYALPLNDRIFYENMATQIQRNYLSFTNQSGKHIDKRRYKLNEKSYFCIWELIDKHSQGRYNSRMWTIILSQISLMCQRPGEAFIKIYKKIIKKDFTDLDYLIEEINLDNEISIMYNKPPLQEIVNELILSLGTAIKLHENYELRDFVKLIIKAFNHVNDDVKYFSDPLLNWNKVKEWLKLFGCPPVEVKDKELQSVEGVITRKPWHEYLKLGKSLLLN